MFYKSQTSKLTVRRVSALLVLLLITALSITALAGSHRTKRLELKVQSLTFNYPNVVRGDLLVGTVTLNGTAPADTVVTLADTTTYLDAPASVTVLSGHNSASFPVEVKAVAGGYAYGGVSATYPVSTTVNASAKVFGSPFKSNGGLNPVKVNSGQSVDFNVYLSFPANTDLDLVMTTTNSTLLPTPATVHIAAGDTVGVATFTAGSSSVDTEVTTSAVYNDYFAKSTVATVRPPTFQGFVIEPTAVDGGTSATGKLTLSAAAPIGGFDVTIQKKSGAYASAPATVTVPAGSALGTFEITTTVPPSPSVSQFKAIVGTKSFLADLTVNTGLNPGVALLKVETNFGPPDRTIRAGVASGSDINGTVYANGIAANDMLVNLATNDTDAYFSNPQAVTIKAGTDHADFVCHNGPINSTKVIRITASTTAPGGGGPVWVDYNLNQYVKSVEFDRAATTKGEFPMLVVNMVGPVKTVLDVAIDIDNAAVSGPAVVKVNPGLTGGTATYSVNPITENTLNVHVGATYPLATRKTTLIKVYKTVLKSVVVNPANLESGELGTVTITLNYVQMHGYTFTIKNSDSTAAKIDQTTVQMLSGISVATIPIQAKSTTIPLAGSVTATSGSFSGFGNYTVKPIQFTAFTTDLTTVVGGKSVAGTLTFNAGAPTGGITVTVGDDSDFVTVPATVKIAEGKATVNFTIKTTKPTTSTTANVNVTFGGVTKTVTLTITP